MSNPLASPDDLKIIINQQANSPIVRYLKSRDNLRFAIGDYLIKQQKRGDKWEAETISGISDIPKTLRCIHIDEFGICYLKPMTSMGTELPTVIQLTEINEYNRYTLDPEYADHMILSDDEKFDFTEQRKKEKAYRDQVTRRNKKIATRHKNLDEIDEIIRGFKPGDKFWFGGSIPSGATAPASIVASVEQVKSYYGSRRSMTWRVNYVIDGYPNADRSIDSESLQTQVLYLQEPFKYETI